jgi:hypothetical protein
MMVCLLGSYKVALKLDNLEIINKNNFKKRVVFKWVNEKEEKESWIEIHHNKTLDYNKDIVNE